MQPKRYAALSLLEQEGPLSAADLAARLGLRREAASMCLLRARRHGLTAFDRRSGVHLLSRRGQERLAWLREHPTGGSP